MAPSDEPAHVQRARAESFGGVAERYDRARPSYPPALVDDLVALAPTRVLDVGCGTGKAGRLLAERGLDVLGVEIDPLMAGLARQHGLDVEVASLEAWEPAGRRFDLIVCGQAWHWVNPAIGVPKAASLLQPGGWIVLFWNVDVLDEPVQAALDRVYRRHAPDLAEATGRGAETLPPFRADLDASGLFEPVVQRSYPWQHRYSRDEWLELIQTRSNHVVLPPDRRARVVERVGQAIDQLGGHLVAHYRTEALFAQVAR